MKEIKKVYGPYLDKKAQRRIVRIFYEDGTNETTQYAKYLLEQNLGRELDKDLETVDHIDGNKLNDDLSNLQVLSRSRHCALDAKRVKLVEITCVWCNKQAFKRAKDLNHNSRQGKAGPFCGKSCAGKYGTSVQNGAAKREGQPSVPVEEREYYTNKNMVM